MRAREQTEDAVKANVRDALRNIQRSYTSYQIQKKATEQAVTRRERALMFLEAGRGDFLTLSDAQDDLLTNQISLSGAMVNYAVARLQLLRDLEGLVLEPKGLRYDPGLPLPQGPLPGSGENSEAESSPAPTEAPDEGDKR